MNLLEGIEGNVMLGEKTDPGGYEEGEISKEEKSGGAKLKDGKAMEQDEIPNEGIRCQNGCEKNAIGSGKTKTGQMDGKRE